MKIAERQLRKIIREALDEAGGCWVGYKPGAQSGKKTKVGKSGKRVNNCEPISETDSDLEEADEADTQNVSEGMQYHFDAGVGFDKSIYRPGSKEFFKLFVEARRLYRSGNYKPKSVKEYEILEFHDIGEYGMYQDNRVPLDFPMNEAELDEAKYKGREVTLGVKGAQKGEGGKSYVYVRDPDDGKVKKVSFGSSMPDAMGDSDAHKKRRKSYGDRHACAKKKDKMAPGYWACRATKMFGKSIPGWW